MVAGLGTGFSGVGILVMMAEDFDEGDTEGETRASAPCVGAAEATGATCFLSVSTPGYVPVPVPVPVPGCDFDSSSV